MVDLVATASATFNPYQYVPPSIQDDYATGMAYYQQFSAAAGGVSVVNGTVQLSDDATQKIYNAMLVAFEAAVPVLGAALAVFMSVMPAAGPGPGVCSTNPPPAGSPPTQAQLETWPYYSPWTSSFPAYDLGAPGSFERYANAALQFNWELFANCYSSSAIPPAVLLATLVASWNATHYPPTRTITRSGLNPVGFGLGPDFDPIAYALTNAISAAAVGSASGTESWTQEEADQAATPHNVTSSFAINNGPLIVGSILSPGGGITPADLASAQPAAAAPTSLSTSSKVGLTVAIVGGSAAAGVGVWAFVTKQAYGEAWSRLLKKVLL